MEALVHWFSQNLSQYISPEGAVFIISMMKYQRMQILIKQLVIIYHLNFQ